MYDTAQQEPAEKTHIMLGLLETVGRDSSWSQRGLASELGIALGLVNAYLKRCVKKGFVKVSETPARRYVYYLTPQGFAEKSRLTAEYLAASFGFFRQAKSDCARVFETAKVRGFARVVLAGRSDLAEIATICAIETGTTIVAIVVSDATDDRFMGLPVVPSFDDVLAPFDAIIVTDQVATAKAFATAVTHCGEARVLVPDLLRGRIDGLREETP